MITLYNVVSADGFILKIDRSEDFIPDEMWVEFLRMCSEYGNLIIGRKTYDTLQKYDGNLLMDLETLPIKKVVVSRDEKFAPKTGYVLARSPKEAYELVKNEKGEALLSSGPTINTSMVKENLITKVILEKLPVRIGEGDATPRNLTMFDEEDIKVELTLVSKEDKGGGRERCEYTIAGIHKVE